MDLAPHALDILDYLLGPLGHVTGDAVNMSPGKVECRPLSCGLQSLSHDAALCGT